jgi:aminoglycoside phosphotransferase (APT) family kinase protein
VFARPPQGFSKTRAESAVGRAVGLARGAGLDVSGGEIVSEGVNVLVRLEPARALARVSQWSDILHVDGAFPWHAREAELSRYLADAGVPVPRPLAGPFLDDGITISFWEWVDHDPRPELSDAQLGACLAVLHATLAGYEGELPGVRAVVAEVDPLAGYGAEADTTAALRRKLAHLLGELDRHDPGRGRPLHGDAHAGNVIAVDGRFVWLDFEEACCGPVEYDLASLVAFARLLGDRDERALLAGYGGTIAHDLLELMVEARLLLIATWCAVLLTEAPDDPVFRNRLDWWLENCAR